MTIAKKVLYTISVLNGYIPKVIVNNNHLEGKIEYWMLLLKYGFYIDFENMKYLDEDIVKLIVSLRGGDKNWKNTLVTYKDMIEREDWVREQTAIHYLTTYGVDFINFVLDLFNIPVKINIPTHFPYERDNTEQMEYDLKKITDEISEDSEIIKILKEHSMIIYLVPIKTDEIIKNLFNSILYSNKAMNELEKDFIIYYYDFYMNNLKEAIDLDKIKFVEKRVVVLDLIVKFGGEINNFKLNDFMKYVKYLKNDKDISKGLSIKKSEYKSIWEVDYIKLYEKLFLKIDDKDLLQNGKKYAKFLHHYKKISSNKEIKKRLNKYLRGYNKELRKFKNIESKIENYILNNDVNSLYNILNKYPNFFVTYFSKILWSDINLKELKYYNILEKIDNKLLIRLYNYIIDVLYYNYHSINEKYITFPNGKTVKYDIEKRNKKINENKEYYLNVLYNIIMIIKYILKNRLKKYNIIIDNDKLFSDYAFANIDFSLRGDGEDIRFKRVFFYDAQDMNYLRVGIWWLNGNSVADYDLSVGFIGENELETLGWDGEYKIAKDNNIIAVFSGDVTSAPKPYGASEFVDIDLYYAKLRYDLAIISIKNWNKSIPTELVVGVMNIDEKSKIKDALNDKTKSYTYFEPEKLINYTKYSGKYIENNHIMPLIIDLRNGLIYEINIISNTGARSLKQELNKRNIKSIYQKYKAFHNILYKFSFIDIINLIGNNTEIEGKENIYINDLTSLKKLQDILN